MTWSDHAEIQIGTESDLEEAPEVVEEVEEVTAEKKKPRTFLSMQLYDDISPGDVATYLLSLLAFWVIVTMQFDLVFLLLDTKFDISDKRTLQAVSNMGFAGTLSQAVGNLFIGLLVDVIGR